MKVIVGLGNPGKKFEKTRHNVGFLVLDELRKSLNFKNFKKSEKFLAKISKGKFKKEKIILVKPQTFMNNSGKAVKLLISNFKLETENLWVVHDDLDVPLGKMKISFGKGSGGHKGVQSIIDELKTKNFFRFRIGILKDKKGENLKEFVLEKFKKEEMKTLRKVIKKAIEAIKISLKESLEKAMSEFNK